jgi:hypothetical protein
MRLEERLPRRLARRGIGGLEEVRHLRGKQSGLPPAWGMVLTYSRRLPVVNAQHLPMLEGVLTRRLQVTCLGHQQAH